MKTTTRTQRNFLTVALLASLSATALFVASAEESRPGMAAGNAVAAAFDPTTPMPASADIPVAPVIELPATVVVLVSIPRQELHVYRGGVRIARSSISSGKPGHDTPEGVFPILQKKRMHHSNLYDDAPMPFMQRLTWGGVALHSGRNPGYPASHGCIRLPKQFAAKLFAVTDVGTPVVVGSS